VLLFGGMDVSSQPTNVGIDEPPAASLSDVVFVFDADQAEWKRCTPDFTMPSPAPRAVHNAACWGTTMVIGCGFTVTPQGHTLSLADCWAWSVETGAWSRMEHCSHRFASKRPPTALYYDQLVVVPNLHEVHFLDLRARSEWQHVASSTSGRRIVQRSPFDPANAFAAPPRPLPDSAERFMLQQATAARKNFAQDAYSVAIAPHVWQTAVSVPHKFISVTAGASPTTRVAFQDSPPPPMVEVKPLSLHVAMDADPWSAGAALGNKIVASPGGEEPELQRLRVEVERLRRIADPDFLQQRARHRADLGSAATSSMPPAAVAALSPPQPSKSYIHAYIASEEAKKERADLAPTTPRSMLLRSSEVSDADLPPSLLDYRRYRQRRQGSATPVRAAAPPPAAPKGRHVTPTPTPRARTAASVTAPPLLSPNRDRHTDMLAMLPSGRGRPQQRPYDEVADPSWAPPAKR
jgi:hypothetical protein